MKEMVIGQLLAVLQEGIEGSASPSYFLDAGADAALLGTLAKLNAEQASREWAGSSIAAHVQHTKFGMVLTAAWIRGERAGGDWEQSWGTRTVDEAGWARLRDQTRAAYQELRQAITDHATDSVEALGGAIGGLAHVAYHLGAIRQKVAAGRQW